MIAEDITRIPFINTNKSGNCDTLLIRLFEKESRFILFMPWQLFFTLWPRNLATLSLLRPHFIPNAPNVCIYQFLFNLYRVLDSQCCQFVFIIWRYLPIKASIDGCSIVLFIISTALNNSSLHTILPYEYILHEGSWIPIL